MVIAQYGDRAEIDLVDGTFTGALALVRGGVVGALLMLHDAQNIQAVDAVLRIQQRRQQPKARHSFASLVGESWLMQRTVLTARRYARTVQKPDALDHRVHCNATTRSTS